MYLLDGLGCEMIYSREHRVGHLDAGFDICLGNLGDRNDFKPTPLTLL